MNELVSPEKIETMIFVVRGKKVMLDRDLATLYAVPAKALNQAVKRNLKRFPDDFMFQLTKEESNSLRSQIVTLNIGRGQYSKYLPYAFTEQGVAMLSSVLKSEQAIEINVQIIRAFVRLRTMIVENKDIRLAIEKLERRVDKHDLQIKVAFDSLKSLLDHPCEPVPPRRGSVSFGFVPKKGAAPKP